MLAHNHATRKKLSIYGIDISQITEADDHENTITKTLTMTTLKDNFVLTNVVNVKFCS